MSYDDWSPVAGNNTHADPTAQTTPIANGSGIQYLNDAVRILMATFKSNFLAGVLQPNTIAGIRALTAVDADNKGTPSTMIWAVVTDATLYFYSYDPTDTSTADNGTTVLVDLAGRRWDRSTSGINITTGSITGDDAQTIATNIAGDTGATETIKDAVVGDLAADDLAAIAADFTANTTEAHSLFGALLATIDADNARAIVAAINADAQAEQNLASALRGNSNAFQTLNRHIDGTAVTPAITFTSNTDCGFFLSGSAVNVAIEGSAVCEFNANGIEPDRVFLGGSGSANAPAVQLFESSGLETGIFASAHTVRFSAADNDVGYFGATGLTTLHCVPDATATYSLGFSGTRWSYVYLSNSPDVSSDERLKQDFGELIDDRWLDFWADIRWTSYRMKRDVAQAGAAAPHAVGLVAQEVERVATQHNLPLSQLAFLKHHSWPEERDEAGAITQPAGEEYSVIYEQALALEAMWQRRENTRIYAMVGAATEALTRLEHRITELEEERAA